ncbi:MAG: response regulator [Gammaproteobacteria bacterium]|nr:response regulator [Gammaproteobacteria bacterium]MDP2348535.1 response regulator [Gammaproteobacteria bacterium]
MARILVIDDSPLQSLCMSRILQTLSHDVLCHADSQQALQVVNRQQVDLVLVELLMQTGNGFETGLLLREAGYSTVVLLTGVYRETDEIWARALGLAGVITRPQAPERLQTRINSILMKQSTCR